MHPVESGGEGASAEAPLPSGRFAGREAFQTLIRSALATAAQQGWTQMVFCDASFEDWPLRERAVVDSLQAWAKTGRQLTLLATRYDSVMRDQPRFVTWRRTWGHIIEARQCKGVDPLDFPSAIWSPHWAMQRLDPVRSTGVCGGEADRRVGLRELLNERLRASSPGFPASVLGL